MVAYVDSHLVRPPLSSLHSFRRLLQEQGNCCETFYTELGGMFFPHLIGGEPGVGSRIDS